MTGSNQLAAFNDYTHAQVRSPWFHANFNSAVRKIIRSTVIAFKAKSGLLRRLMFFKWQTQMNRNNVHFPTGKQNTYYLTTVSSQITQLTFQWILQKFLLPAGLCRLLNWTFYPQMAKPCLQTLYILIYQVVISTAAINRKKKLSYSMDDLPLGSLKWHLAERQSAKSDT